MDEYITVAEFSERYRIPEPTVRRWVNERRIPSIRAAQTIRIPAFEAHEVMRREVAS